MSSHKHTSSETATQTILSDLLRELQLPNVAPITLRARTSVVYLLESLQLVVKLSCGPDILSRAAKEISVAAYLQRHSVPAVRPATSLRAEPTEIGGWVATLWHYTPTVRDLNLLEAGRLLRNFHQIMRTYPNPVPTFDPLSLCEERLRRLMNGAAFGPPDLSWLRHRCQELRPRLQPFNSRLGELHIHGDFHLGNVIASAAGPVLSDFEEVSLGYAEWDLIAILVGNRRFGLSDAHLSAFFAGYGVDPRSYADSNLLVAARELSMVIWLAEHGVGDEAVTAEVSHRIASLRTGTLRRWTPM